MKNSSIFPEKMYFLVVDIAIDLLIGKVQRLSLLKINLLHNFLNKLHDSHIRVVKDLQLDNLPFVPPIVEAIAAKS